MSESEVILHDESLLRWAEIQELRILPISRAAFYAQIQEGVAPPPKKLGPRIAAWTWKDLRAYRDGEWPTKN